MRKGGEEKERRGRLKVRKQKHNVARQGVRATRAAKEKARKRKRFWYIILIVLVILGIMATPMIVNKLHNEDNEGNIQNEEPVVEEPQEEEPVEEEKLKEEKVDVSNMPSSFHGYPVIRRYIH